MYIPKCRPLLLLLDGHASHFCPEVIKMAVKEKVIIFALPPNTTHLAQPLDRGCFSPLKTHWKQVVQDFVALNHRAVTRYDFCSLFSQAWINAMTMKNVMAGFRVCGVYPFNREALVLPEEEYTSFKLEALPQISGLKYIPMYTVQHVLELNLNLSPASLPQRVSTPIERGSGFNDLLDDSLPECSLLSRQHSYSESSLCDLSFDYTADQSKCSMPLRKATSLSDFLVTPTPPSRLVTKRPKSCGRVLTSSENIRQLEEKEEKKRTALKEKGERRKLREESKLQREAEKSAKKIGKHPFY